LRVKPAMTAAGAMTGGNDGGGWERREQSPRPTMVGRRRAAEAGNVIAAPGQARGDARNRPYEL